MRGGRAVLVHVQNMLCMYVCMYVYIYVRISHVDLADRSEGEASSSGMRVEHAMYVCMYVCVYVCENFWRTAVRGRSNTYIHAYI